MSNYSPHFLFSVEMREVRKIFLVGQHRYLIEHSFKAPEDPEPTVELLLATEYEVLRWYKAAAAAEAAREFPTFSEAFPALSERGGAR